ncbi:MAG: metallophosphoesterase [Anaerolineae bacterium]|nr:metallophosphoesterase [Anaerolineae bacterium]
MPLEALLHFVHISDTHLLAPNQIKDFSGIQPELALYAEQVLAWPHHPVTAMEALIREINTLPLKLDFVLHTGDIAGEDQSDYAWMTELFNQLRYPVIYLPGNHDRGADLTPLYPQAGQPIYELEVNGVQIVCLDSCHAEIRDAGWLDAEQLSRLETICAAPDTRPLLVALHHHPLPIDVAWLDNLRLGNGETFHQILLRARHRLCGVFCGHIHHSVDIFRDGILYSSVASAAYQFLGWPGQAQSALDMRADPGFNMVTVTPEQTLVRHHRYRIVRG